MAKATADKEFNEPEENTSTVEIKDTKDFSPFDEPINEKSYTKANVNMSEQERMQDIPEPVFAPPPLNADVKSDNDTQQKAEPKPKPQTAEPLNPEMNTLSNKEKKAAGDHAANMILQGYSWIWNGINKKMLFSEKKMQKLSNDGEVDFNIQIPYDLEGHTISAAEFIEEYNKQQDGVLSVSQEFIDDVKPVLARVLAKRGIAMTDEQYLIFAFGKDALNKGVMVYSAIQTMNDMIKGMKDMTTAIKESGRPAPQPNPPVTPSYTPPPPTDDNSGSQAIEPEEIANNGYEETIEVPVAPFHTNDTMNDLEDRVEVGIGAKPAVKTVKRIVKPTPKKSSANRGAPKKK